MTHPAPGEHSPIDRLANRNGGRRVAYDARLSIGQYRGMGRFLRQLIAGREEEFLGLCATGESDSSLKLVSRGFKPYPIWEQLSIPRLVKQLGIDVFLAPYNTAPLNLPKHVRLVIAVHDLIFLDPMPKSRSSYQNLGRMYRQLVVPRAIARANAIVTVSDYTAGQLVSRFALSRDRIRVIPNTIDKEWFFETAVSREPSPKYILVVAGEAPSKNLNRAIAAFGRFRDHYKKEIVRLKIAGVKPKFHEGFAQYARKLGVAEYIDFIGYVSDVEMRKLYLEAELFLMPSLSEGFGIPVLEAMASGVPAVISSATSLPEIGGAAARYFDPTSVDDMAGAILEVASNASLRHEMSRQGILQARKFHPDGVRENIKEFWAQLLQEN